LKKAAYPVEVVSLKMKITPDVFEAYLKCPTKCWLRATDEPSAGGTYPEWVKAQNGSYRVSETRRLVAESANDEVVLSPDMKNFKAAKWRLTSSLAVQTQMDSCTLESELHALECVPAEGRGKPAQFIPIRFVFTNKLGKDDKLVLAFDAFALSRSLGRGISLGKIIHGDDHATLKVKTSALTGEVRKRLERIATLLSNPEPPDLVLNPHCPECEFQARCRQKAVEKDDLSLLSNMSEKERKNFNSKGIFGVTQLSYTFRPRRRPKQLTGKREKYHHSLKALAIRERKIHIVGSPELKMEGTPVYLDVEGLPDREFYYLIGLRFRTGRRVIQHNLWAANENDEKRIWKEFLGVLSGIKKPVLIHYGSFETTFLRRMDQKYGEVVGGSCLGEAISSAVNLLSVIFANVYFPTFSNGIKEIAKYLGFEWETPEGSGLQSIIWRSQWEASGGAAVKRSLIIYNANDCEALEVVANKLLQLQQLSQNPEQSPDIVFTASLKWKHPFGFKRNKFALTDLDTINKAAYWDYQRERVYVKSHGSVKRALKFASHQKKSVRPNKIIACSRPRSCTRCGASKIYKHTKGQKTVFDLKFTPNGIKRWVVRYTFFQYYCQICKTTFKSPKRNWTRSKFGSEIRAYALYQNIELRLPQEAVDRSLKKLFGLPLALGTTNNFKEEAAEKYQITYNTLIKGLTSGPLLHADETKISIKTGNGFVWVFANMQQVVYIYSETREANILHTLLKDFTGVLVSDFYPAYEGIQCSQQKCLIHLIRDLNDDLLKHPFDEELKWLARAFSELLRPMVETIDRHGLQSRFLKQHLTAVDKFYRRLWKLTPRSEVASKTKQRFEKNRDTLFTFLKHDGVPWNNNNAEHAVKAFATLRRVIKGVTSEAGLRDYLVLLSICETCNYQGLDFLDFLRSGETDIADFADSRQKRRF
jgi:predicted RecB family nuclease